MTRLHARLWLVGVLLLAFALYAPSLGNTFAYDDRYVAISTFDSGAPNEMVAELQPLHRYFESNYWHGTSDRDVLYRPVTILSYALVYAAVGRHLEGEAGEAMPQHALNLALHLCAVWLTYLMVRRLGLGRLPAVVAALVFGVHAIHSEVVAGVVGRSELLAFCFGAAGTLAASHAWSAKGTRRALGLVGAALALFLACCSKESAVAWVAFLPVFAIARTLLRDPRAPLPRLIGAEVARAAAVGAVPVAVFLLLRHAMITGLPADAVAGWTALQEAKKTAGLGRASAVVQWGYALLVTVVPFHLAADHGPSVFDPVRSFADVRFAAAALALIALLGAGLWQVRRRPVIFLAAACFLGFSCLTSNVLFPIGTDYAERLYYTPSLGAALGAAWVASRLRAPAPRVLAAAALAAWMVWCGSMILQRNGVWANDEALFAHELQNQPRSIVVHYNWAGILAARGRMAEATAELERAIALAPELAEPKHYNLLGVFRARAGRYDEAVRYFEKALATGFATPRVRADVWLNLAGAQVRAGRYELAVEPIERAVQLDPETTPARVAKLVVPCEERLGVAWLDGVFGRGEASATGTHAWTRLRGELAYRHERYGEARDHLERFLAAAPRDRTAPEARLLLASALATLGDRPRALELARQVAADAGARPAVREQARQLVQKIEAAPGGR